MLKVKNRVTRSGGRRPRGLVEFRGGKTKDCPWTTALAMASLPRALSLAFCVACCDIALSLSPGRPTSRCPWRPGL